MPVTAPLTATAAVALAPLSRRTGRVGDGDGGRGVVALTAVGDVDPVTPMVASTTADVSGRFLLASVTVTVGALV